MKVKSHRPCFLLVGASQELLERATLLFSLSLEGLALRLEALGGMEKN